MASCWSPPSPTSLGGRHNSGARGSHDVSHHLHTAQHRGGPTCLAQRGREAARDKRLVCARQLVRIFRSCARQETCLAQHHGPHPRFGRVARALHKPCACALHKPCACALHKPSACALHKPCACALHKPCACALHKPCASGDGDAELRWIANTSPVGLGSHSWKEHRLPAWMPWSEHRLL
jgi:hypothetical protein